MNSLITKYALIFLLAITGGCEFSVKPPKMLKDYFKTEADTQYYEKKCRRLLAQLNSNLTQYGIRRIAVVDFPDIEGRVSELGRFLSSEVMVQVPRETQLIVVQRGHVEEALKELELVPNESYTLENTRKLGKKLVVDGILFGKIVDLGTNIDINIKLVDSNTGDVAATASESIVRSKYAVEMSTKYVDFSD